MSKCSFIMSVLLCFVMSVLLCFIMSVLLCFVADSHSMRDSQSTPKQRTN